MPELRLSLPTPPEYTHKPDQIYDDVEMHVCTRVQIHDESIMDSLGSASEQDEQAAQKMLEAGEIENWCFSVYWHLSEGGVRWVADFPKSDRADAERLYCAMMASVCLANGDIPRALEFGSTAVGATA